MSSKAKTVADFMRENDKATILRNRILARLEALRKIGPEHSEGELEFCRAAQVGPNEIGFFRVEFKAHIAFVPKLLGKKPKYVWFGAAKAVPAKFRYVPESDNG